MAEQKNLSEDKQYQRKKALLIGTVFVFAYLCSYYVRKLLGLARLEMVATELFSELSIDSFQSVFLFFYAGGQLVNGFIGDYIKPKYMISGGYLLAGISIVVFPFCQANWLVTGCFALFGFGLSMLRGPMMKLFAENLTAEYMRIVCMFLSFTAYFSTAIASVMVDLFAWKAAFQISGVLLMLISVILFLLTAVMKKTGFITEPQMPEKTARSKFSLKGMLGVFSIPGFVFCVLIGALVELFGTGVMYFLPSYMEKVLEMPSTEAKATVSAISMASAVCCFMALLLYKWFKHNTVMIFRVMFAVSALAYLGTMFFKVPALVVGLILLAQLGIGCVSSVLWTVYLPSLGKTGKVSSANGVMDFGGYMGAVLGTMLFNFLGSVFDWTGIVISWVALALVGLLASVFQKNLDVGLD